ncbi:hypothetical protein C7S13_7426 [Burkholderia cepacia]|nr:hypothetical protein [Burkholderia cepacia]
MLILSRRRGAPNLVVSFRKGAGGMGAATGRPASRALFR